MSTRLVHRPARTVPVAEPLPALEVQRPKSLPDARSGRGNLLMLAPLMAAATSMTVMMLFRGSSWAAVGAIMMVVTVLATAVLMISQQGRATRVRREQRDRYLDYLEELRSRLVAEEHVLVRRRGRNQPEAGALLSVVRNPARLWERRRGDADFLELRLGSHRGAAREFSPAGQDNPLDHTDEFMVVEMERVLDRFRTAYGLPLSVRLADFGHTSVVGEPAFVDQVGRLLLAQASVLHSPDDVQIAAAIPPERAEDWRWVTELPHARLGDQPAFAQDVTEMLALIGPELERRTRIAAEARRNFDKSSLGRRFPALLVLVDQRGQRAERFRLPDPDIALDDLGVVVVHLLDDPLAEPEQIRHRLRPGTDGIAIETYPRADVDPIHRSGALDAFSVPAAAALARALAPLRLSPESSGGTEAEQLATTRFLELLGIDDPNRIELNRLWRPRTDTGFLKVPIGFDDAGAPVVLDLKEAAQFGQGPHGLCVGATGSGKSELLRTLVLALLCTHPPEDLTMVLVDYKGGATFAPFDQVPHVAGIITNLADDASLIERVYTSLQGEVLRRQQVLKDAGNMPDITSYREQRARTGPTEFPDPMPHLLVIIDEFGELLTARPDFIELFLSIGRIGRSIGVHLLLSSQRIEGGRLRGLDTYLSYRLGLRTLSDAESRTVLETADAFTLPPLPGYGYLKVDTTTYTRFRAGFVSNTLADDAAAAEQPTLAPEPHLAERPLYASLAAPDDQAPAPVRPRRRSGPTVLDAAVAQLRQRPRVTAPIWLPPLPSALTLDQLAGPPVPTAAGLRLPPPGRLQIPVGLLDDPARQYQAPWLLDLSANGGHTLIVGAPQTGKSGFLRLIAAAAALTHGPGELSCYAVDLLGGGLAPLIDLPSVGGVATRMDRDAVRRTVEELLGVVTEREALFRRHGVDSLAALGGSLGPDHGLDLSEKVLLLDGYGQIFEEFEAVESALNQLLRRGAAFGVHVVATAVRWNEVRMAQQGQFGTRIEFRMTDPMESSHGRKVAENLPKDTPGRALLGSGLFAQAALPRIDGDASVESSVEGLRRLIRAVSVQAAERARPVRMLPAVLRGADLPPAAAVRIGLEESRLRAARIDLLADEPLLVVLGDGRTGRSGVLRQVVAELIGEGPEEVVFGVFDPRRGLRDLVPEPLLGGYANSAALAGQLSAAIAGELAARVPASPDDTQLQSAAGGAAPRPRIVLLIDDYDVLTAGGNNPLGPLQPYISQAAEIGLAIVLVRRMSGAGRAVHDQFLGAMRESGATALLLSGDRSEGSLFGVRPRKQPPGRGDLIRPGEDPVTIQTVSHEQGARREPQRDRS